MRCQWRKDNKSRSSKRYATVLPIFVWFAWTFTVAARPMEVALLRASFQCLCWNWHRLSRLAIAKEPNQMTTKNPMKAVSQFVQNVSSLRLLWSHSNYKPLCGPQQFNTLESIKVFIRWNHIQSFALWGIFSPVTFLVRLNETIPSCSVIK